MEGTAGRSWRKEQNGCGFLENAGQNQFTESPVAYQLIANVAKKP